MSISQIESKKREKRLFSPLSIACRDVYGGYA